MGCCISTNNKPKPKPQRKTTNNHIPNSKTTTKQIGVSKSPPPTHPLPEEKIVKEILSETPAAIKPSPSPIPTFRPKNASPFIKSAPLLRDTDQQKKPSAADDASEMSEICSTLSETASASTSVPEKRDRKDELRRSPARVRNRSSNGEIHRAKTVGRSPGRRSEPSPGRVRPATGNGRRRESGESSGRRSTSPAMRAEASVGRAPPGSKMGRSPGRVGNGSGDRIRKLEAGKESVEGKRGAPTNGSNESLENPLVSLECFIFL